MATGQARYESKCSPTPTPLSESALPGAVLTTALSCGALLSQEDYYTHDCRGAYDLAESTAKSAAGPQVAKTAFEYNNTYSTYPFTAHAVSVIEDLKADTPLFLYM